MEYIINTQGGIYMRTISIINLKGGVAKTTSMITLCTLR